MTHDLGPDDGPQHPAEILPQARDGIDDKETRQAQQERGQQQQGDLEAGVEKLVESAGGQAAEGPHHRAVERAAGDHQDHQPAQPARQRRLGRKHPASAQKVIDGLEQGTHHKPSSLPIVRIMSTKMLASRPRNHWKGSSGEPMNGRRIQPIWAPTRA